MLIDLLDGVVRGGRDDVTVVTVFLGLHPGNVVPSVLVLREDESILEAVGVVAPDAEDVVTLKQIGVIGRFRLWLLHL